METKKSYAHYRMAILSMTLVDT